MPNKRKRRGKGKSGGPKRMKGNLEPDGLGSSARCDDVGPSNRVREPGSELPEPCFEDTKHKIFLSHSGAQKDFTWQLCEDLKRVHHFSFFDREEDSLPKGEKFPALIVEAAERCRVAVVVLSDEFFSRSKWPMIELNEFVKAQESANRGVKLLPLFLGITMKQYAEKKRQRRWLEKWKGFASDDDRINVEEWKHALSKIPGGINAMEYGGVGEGEVAFRKRVVEAVCKLLPPDVKYDVSDIESMERLCEPIVRKMEEVKPSSGYNVRVVGLHGMGGVGKTTITRAICNEMYGDFCGKVCHVELGGTNSVELLKRVLRELTEASGAILDNEHGKLAGLLKDRMRRQKVCLILDNVWEEQISEAMMYLRAGYHEGSMVVVTARSRDVLGDRLHIADCNCMEMPNLEREGAIGVFLKNAGISQESIQSGDEWRVIGRCVDECCFLETKSREKHKRSRCYHPLALKVLGSQLGGMGGEVSRWVECLAELKADKFNMLKERVHPIFSVLGRGYDALKQEEQDLFLDLAVLVLSESRSDPRGWINLDWESWGMIVKKTGAEMKASVKALQRKGLVEKGEDVAGLGIKIHDLYIEFAEKQVQAEAIEKRRFLIHRGGVVVPRDFMECPPSGSCWSTLKRVIIHRNKIESLNCTGLHLLKNVEVLDLDFCEELREIDVTGMDNLRCIVVTGCGKLEKWVGLEKLSNLVIFRWYRWGFFKFHRDRSSSTALRLGLSEENSLLDLSGCTNLRELTLNNNCLGGMFRDFYALGELSKMPKSVTKIDFSWCPYNVGMSRISSISLLTNLQDLNLHGCGEIEDLTGVGELISLRILDVGKTRISVLPSGLGSLKHLEILDLSKCKVTSIVVIGHVTSLRIVRANFCGELKELPDDLSKLEKLEQIDLSYSEGLCTLPTDYERFTGYRGSRVILRMEVDGCWGLVSPLLERLRGPETRGENCVDACVFGDMSMQSWIDGRRSVDVAAYELLKSVFGRFAFSLDGRFDDFLGTLNLHEVEFVDILIRALCEHYNRGRETHKKSTSMSWPGLSGGTYLSLVNLKYFWLVPVATAPCTIRAVTGRAKLQPWRKTLLHFTIKEIVPVFGNKGYDLVLRFWTLLLTGDFHENDCLAWRLKGMVVMLGKCREMLEEALVQGIDPARTNEVLKVLDTSLNEIALVGEGSTLFEHTILWSPGCYEKFFPHFLDKLTP